MTTWDCFRNADPQAPPQRSPEDSCAHGSLGGNGRRTCGVDPRGRTLIICDSVTMGNFGNRPRPGLGCPRPVGMGALLAALVATGLCPGLSDITGGPREGETKDQRLWVAGRFRPPSAPDL